MFNMSRLNYRLLCNLLLSGIAISVIAATARAEPLGSLPPLGSLTMEQRTAAIDAWTNDETETLTEPPLTTPVLVMPRNRDVEDSLVQTAGESATDRQSKKTSLKKRGSHAVVEPFGYDLFSGVPTTFAPATDIPISSDYIVGPGDNVLIQLFGKEHAQYSLVITREGELHIPDIGPISVVGLTFVEMKKMLTEQISKQMIGEDVVVAMGALRSIRVFILGDASRPGSYTVSALSTMTNALFVSGGVKDIGSLRNIQLKRQGKVITRLDLYDLLLDGDTSSDVRLQPGDVIFIPPVGKTVAVSGEVRRPAVYELRDEKTASQVLHLAGGLLPTAYAPASQILHINKDRERTLIDVDLASKAGLTTEMHTGDELQIFSILEKMENIVVLSGHAQRPGGYQWHKGMRVGDLISSINDDLLPHPDLEYALVKRDPGDGKTLEVFSIRIGEVLASPSSSENIQLQARDEVIVFGFGASRTDEIDSIIDELRSVAVFGKPARVVKVGGLVRLPGEYPLEHHMSVADLIRAAGGLAEAAYGLEAELTRYQINDGEQRQIGHVAVKLDQILSGERSADFALHAHDYLHIKALPAWSSSSMIELKGEVRFPGMYPISRGEQLSNVIRRAGGFTDLAFLNGAMFFRVELKNREKKRLDELSRRLEADLASLAVEQSHEDKKAPDSLLLGRELADQLRNVDPVGRLVIDINRLVSETSGGRRSDYDIRLMDGDQLYIPPVTQEVIVTGEVFYPTSHLFERGRKLGSYVKMSGGATKKADENRIYIVRADGSVKSQSGTAFEFDNEDGTPWFNVVGKDEIRAGDTIVVPLDIDRMKPLTFWTGVSKIVFELAFAAASAKAIGVF